QARYRNLDRGSLRSGPPSTVLRTEPNNPLYSVNMARGQWLRNECKPVDTPDWEAAMLTQSLPLVIPPAPKVHAKDLPVWRHLLLAQRNSIGIFPDYAFDVPFARRALLGVNAVLINDPEGIRHVLATNANNYVRPKMMPR